MKSLRLCAVALFAVALSGQAQPRDIDGWGKIHWGMTIADASQAYVIDRHEDNESWSQLIATPVQIGDLLMRLSFGAKHGSEQISRVRLWMNFGGRNSAANASPADFDTLKTQLIQKYGPPIDGETRTEGTDAIKTFLWTFPSTSIRLTLTQAQGSQGRIDLEYDATDKSALDVL
jgi:hypothetical protein